jgi:hypothetical protein
MPAVARTIEVETRQAWDTYAASVAGLTGPEYDAAEQDAWAVLQETLDELRVASTSLNRPPVG